MCAYGDSIMLRVFIPAELSYTGHDRYAEKPIDRCLAPIVRALTLSGVVTIGSCCGHGIAPGSIMLIDGHELIITGDAS